MAHGRRLQSGAFLSKSEESSRSCANLSPAYPLPCTHPFPCCPSPGSTEHLSSCSPPPCPAISGCHHEHPTQGRRTRARGQQPRACLLPALGPGSRAQPELSLRRGSFKKQMQARKLWGGRGTDTNTGPRLIQHPQLNFTRQDSISVLCICGSYMAPSPQCPSTPQAVMNMSSLHYKPGQGCTHCTDADLNPQSD